MTDLDRRPPGEHARRGVLRFSAAEVERIVLDGILEDQQAAREEAERERVRKEKRREPVVPYETPIASSMENWDGSKR